MAYIEEHITDDLALADVANVTAYSPFLFGRFFYYIADMSLSEYIRKRIRPGLWLRMINQKNPQFLSIIPLRSMV